MKNDKLLDKELNEKGSVIPRILLTSFFLIFLLSLGVLSQLGIKMTKQQAPLVHAAMEIKLNVSLFHLWFEELVQGDKSVRPEQVWAFLDASEWYANAMLHGGENSEGTFTHLDDPSLQKELAFVLEGISGLREKGKTRLENSEKGRIGSDLDQAFDKAFGLVLQKADKAEARLQNVISEQLEWYDFISNALIISFIIVSFICFFGLIYYERRRKSDLTTQHALMEQINQSQKLEAIGSLVGSVAHNFNNLLAGIVGKAYMARKNVKDQPEKALTYLESIESISAQAAEMVKQLLTFAHQDFLRDKKNVRLDKLIKEGFEAAKLGVASEIIASLSTTSTDMQVYCDGNQMQLVLLNLMNNARDAVVDCESKVISVSLDVITPDAEFFHRNSQLKAGKFTCLKVADSGCGMDRQTQKNIFEPFYTTKKVGLGTGLGLSTAFGSVTSHGGVIEVESELNKGTIFKVYLPLIEATEEVESEVEGDDGEAIVSSPDNKVLLLVDDEPVLRHSMKEVFENSGYQVITASDGLAGLTCFQQQHVDCIVTDVMMPNMDGVEMFREIRAVDSTVPSIFMTGYDEGLVRLRSDEVENTAVIAKPAKMPELLKLIQRLV